jgi:acetate kinase
LSNFILAINSGSSSIKFGIFTSRDTGAAELYRGIIENIGSDPVFTLTTYDEFGCEKSTIAKHKNLPTLESAFAAILQWLDCSFVPEQIKQICYRVVHGGKYFCNPVEIDAAVLFKIDSLVPLAPLHQPIALSAINLFMKHFPQSRHVAFFDTAFHYNMPKTAQTFALPYWLHEKGVKPYGFHGLSYQYVVGKVAVLNKGNFPRRAVIAHLGSGASMCALLEGKSTSTSMSFSPTDGLPMATRCGRLDASAVLYMIDQLKLSTKDVTDILNRESGLLGLSELSGDVRVLLASDSENARFALAFFVDRICQEFGAMISILHGLDALIFTGGIGANSDVIREKICEKMQWLGVSLEPEANRRNENIISNASSRIQVYSIKTDEELMMAELVSVME